MRACVLLVCFENGCSVSDTSKREMNSWLEGEKREMLRDHKGEGASKRESERSY